ncbi:MAG: FAD-dependent oxidoreductase [Bacteroidota bacterium]
MKKRIVIVGSSFAGYTTALELAKSLKGKHELIVIDKKPEFTFLPSLVWYPFGYRDSSNITFNVLPLYNECGVTFLQTEVYGFDLKDQLVHTPTEDIPYDYLVITTGIRPNYASVKGLLPGINSWSICDRENAEKTKKAWKAFLENPGPMVIGAAQWAGYFFVAYEFLLNALYHLKKRNVLDKAPIYFVTPEPHLTHFGIEGHEQEITACCDLFDHYNVHWKINSEIREVRDHMVCMESGGKFLSDFTMIIPQFTGVNAIKTTRRLADRHGLIHVNEHFQHKEFDQVYAAGGTVFIDQDNETLIPCGVPRTKSASELMAKTVAANILADLSGEPKRAIPNQTLYDEIRHDINHLGFILFSQHKGPKHDLDFIAKGSQDKWTNMSLKQYIDTSFESMNLKL